MELLSFHPAMDNFSQEAFAALLSRQLLRYTRFQSSSVRIQTAEQIARSILYALAALREKKVVDTSMDLDAIYPCALAYLRGQLRRCRFLYAAVKASRLPTSLLSYNSLIDQDIPTFLRNYDPEFHAAEDISFSLYPLCGFPSTGTGVLFVREYLTHLFEENRACAGIPAFVIRSALEKIGRQLGQPPRELTVNLSEILLFESTTFLL